jgi:sugar phosphate isomerase/epimerase
MIDRRNFLGTSAAVLVAGCVRARASSGASQSAARLPIGFSTLGSPNWDWLPTLDFAAAHGYAALELRGIRDQMDLTKVTELQAPRFAETQRQLLDRHLVITDLGASANLHDLDSAKHDPQMDEARRFIDLASAMRVPYVRVFGNKYVAGVPRERTIEQISRSLHELGEYARPRNVVVLLETHGDFTDSPTLLEIMRRADSPGVALLWDAHHTYAFGGEQPEATVREIGRYIRHTHLKDSVPAGGDRRYVLTGTGQIPVRRQVDALARMGYRGYYCFEWEKRWHPEIEEPEVAFAQFATVVAGYMRDAGIRPRMSS